MATTYENLSSAVSDHVTPSLTPRIWAGTVRHPTRVASEASLTPPY